MSPLIDSIKKLRPNLPIIYSAHNSEADHKRALFRGDMIGSIVSSFVEQLEHELIAHADLVVVCTRDDAVSFVGESDKLVLAINGCSLPKTNATMQPRGTGPFRAGFLGSGHPPNVEAALFVLRVLAPLFAEAQFEFVGGVCDSLAGHGLKNVVLYGIVSHAVKSEILSGWDLALNPVSTGGGSSLKLPDYMAHGLATLNTVVGARGFPVSELGLGDVVGLDEFPLAFSSLMKNRANLCTIGARSSAFAADQLSWQSVTVEYRKRLLALMVSPQPPPARRLLVVTYRYTEPVLGGAEEYLISVLQRLRSRFTRIDLAAVDVEQVSNWHQFGTQVTLGHGAAGRIGDIFDAQHFFLPNQLSETELIALGRLISRYWAGEELALMAPLAERLATSNQLHLLAGFFLPEVHNGIAWRWTSPQFTFLAPKFSRVFRLSGISKKQTRLRLNVAQLSADGRFRVSHSEEVEVFPRFELFFGLPDSLDDGQVLLHCEVDEFLAEKDVRSLGILLESAWVLSVDKSIGQQVGLRPLVMHTANLFERLDDDWRNAYVEEWTDSLVGVARRRKDDTDAAFARARGPHVPEMQSWLAEQAHKYDVVLVQGVPFDVVPRSVQTLSQLSSTPRIVILPHFHGDDRFYHWRDYYRAFDTADCTLLFSEFLVDRIVPRKKAAIVNGGGVRLDEPVDPIASEKFRSVHASLNPFFLLLGRKTGSKNYQRVIDAYQIFRRLHPDCDIVMIGPDEDGTLVNENGVSYLGHQSREVVRGALAECLAVVSMSSSESFGIVVCEAWLFGKPVIANAQCCAFRNLINDDVTGILVQSDTELIAAMETLALDAGKRERIGRAGFNEVVENYSWEHVADAIAFELYPVS